MSPQYNEQLEQVVNIQHRVSLLSPFRCDRRVTAAFVRQDGIRDWDRFRQRSGQRRSWVGRSRLGARGVPERAVFVGAGPGRRVSASPLRRAARPRLGAEPGKIDWFEPETITQIMPV